MPINRSSKPLLKPRRGCARALSVRRGFDFDLGIPLITTDRLTRQEVVARARLLVADPGYPPPYVMNAVADLIARYAPM